MGSRSVSMGKDFNRFRAHPWHGLPIGDRAPDVVESYIEITPFDVVKYEIDKRTGGKYSDKLEKVTSTVEGQIEKLTTEDIDLTDAAVDVTDDVADAADTATDAVADAAEEITGN